MSELAALLQRELELLQSFSALLEQERQSLVAGDADALPLINSKKTPLIESLNGVGIARNIWLRGHNLPADREGVEQWIATHPAEKNLEALWKAFLEAAKSARELNTLNGQLVSQQLQSTSEALAILGREAQNRSLYGPNGQATLQTGNRIIDSA